MKFAGFTSNRESIVGMLRWLWALKYFFRPSFREDNVSQHCLLWSQRKIKNNFSFVCLLYLKKYVIISLRKIRYIICNWSLFLDFCFLTFNLFVSCSPYQYDTLFYFSYQIPPRCFSGLSDRK